MKLHIGGTEASDGWSLLNIQNGRDVDITATVLDMPLPDATVDEVYASHVLEHLSYQGQRESRGGLSVALAEIYRVLVPGGLLRVSVPDLEVLCRLFVSPQLNSDQQWHVQRMIMGGQSDEHDFHRVGLTADFLSAFATGAGFRNPRRVDPWNLFDDCSSMTFSGVSISLNMEFDK